MVPKVPHDLLLIIFVVNVSLVTNLLKILTRSVLPLEPIFEAAIASVTYVLHRAQSFKYVEVFGDSKQYTLD